MPRTLPLLAVSALLLTSLPATAQFFGLDTVPAAPVAGTTFAVRVAVAACYTLSPVTVNGTNLDVTIIFAPSCIATPPIVTQTATAGPLPAGTYTLRVISSFDQSVIATAPVTVSADVPLLDSRALALLATALIVVATLRLRG